MNGLPRRPRLRRARRGAALAIGAVALLVAIPWLGGAVLSRRVDPPLGFARGEAGVAEALDARPPSPPLASGAIDGTARAADGAPLAAIVTAFPLDSPAGPRTTVYAGADGRFRFDRLAAGRHSLVARAPAAESAPTEATVSPDAPALAALVLDRPAARPYPAAYYADRLRFPSEAQRTDFRVQCRYCHQQGSESTRLRRTEREWREIVERMRGMGAILRADTLRDLPGILARDMRPDPPPAPPHGSGPSAPAAWVPPPGPAADAVGAVLREWPMGFAGGYIHDIALGPGEWIYAVDMNYDTVEALDTAGGEMRQWRLPRRGHPRGGYLVCAIRAVGTALAHQGPHSVEFAGGKLWITASLGNEIVEMDPATAHTRHWSLPRGAFYPHTHRVRDGHLWFTVALSNHLGHLDLRANRLTATPLPAEDLTQTLGRALMGASFGLASAKPFSDSHLRYAPALLAKDGARFMPLPYGLDVAPDGALWYGKLYGDRIGRFDPRTGALREWKTPFPGPRRLAVARDGGVWIPGFGSGVLARFDPARWKFRVWPLPSSPPGADAPYAVAIAPATGHVWVTSTQTDVLYRFDPASERFTVFPLPTRGAFMREIEFRADGELCTSYSNTPDAHMPDPSVKLLCIRPPPG